MGRTASADLTVANELVPLKCGGDLISARGFGAALRPDHLADAAEIHRLRGILIQRNDVLDRSAEIRFRPGGETDAARTDILRQSGQSNTIGACASDGER